MSYDCVRDQVIISLNVPGEIVECGVFKGTSFVRFALMREILGSQFSSRLLAFDVFSDKYPKTNFKEDRIQRNFWIKTAGGSSISTGQLKKNLKEKKIKKL